VLPGEPLANEMDVEIGHADRPGTDRISEEIGDVPDVGP
jgi:hypothetical protein